MKNSLSVVVLVFVVLFTFNSCDKETEVIVIPSTINPTPVSELTKFFEDNLEDATQTININPSSTQTFTSNKGIVYSFESTTFTNSVGVAVSGNITIELIEALTKKEMMLINKPTFTHSGELLVSGGVVYLNATQNGQQLSINDNNPITVNIPTDNYIPMDFFDGSFDSQGGFGWDESEDDTVITNTAGNDTTEQGFWFSFDFEIDSIGWINCDYFYNSGDPLTQVEVILPDTFNGDNSAVFIYYDDINSVASLNDYDADGTFDLGANYSTPIGMDVSFVVISESNGSYFYTIVSTTIVQDHVQIIASLTEVTEAELELILNAL
ncbi:hypothetical protein N8904_00035 [Flavobacteriales bacterium]|nr:hypothetical protein [Flavobacteriales bacterium]